MLVIDDDLVSREVVATVLTMNGYSVHTADCGRASLELLAGGEVAPQVILMDAQMPGLGGVALINELRAHSQASIVAFSGSNPGEEVTAAADGFLLKPFDMDALSKVIDGFEVHTEDAPRGLDPNAPVISAEVLEQLRQLMPERAVREIYMAIVSDLARRTKALDTAMANGDAAEVHRIGHAIKGGCAMAGALQAAQLGGLIEAAPGDFTGNQFDNMMRLLDDLRTAARALESMLDAELPARPQAS